MTPQYTELQLDALRELANIASGNAATALSQMLGRPVDLSVPRVLAVPLADAVEACGRPEDTITGVVIPLEGDIEGIVLLLISSEGARRCADCSASRPAPRSAIRRSARSATSSAPRA